MPTYQSPVKHKMKTKLKLKKSEFPTAIEFYNLQNVSYINKGRIGSEKESKVNIIVSWIAEWLRKYSREQVFAGIEIWNEKARTKEIIPGKDTKARRNYIEGIIRNHKPEEQPVVNIQPEAELCLVCGAALVNGECTRCE